MKLGKLAVIPAIALGLGLAACSQAVSVTPATPPPVKVKINNNVVVTPSPSRVGLLSSGEQASMGSYSQWAADRSDISAEYATLISESGDQVTVSLQQNHYDGSSSNTTATFTVDDGVITAVS
jgi:hypothetical protein